MERRRTKEMCAATVWGWEDRFEDVGRNCKKYVDKRWKENVKECSIEIMARERSEGIRYWLTAYVNSPEYVERIAEDLFHVALLKGSTKVSFVNIYLFDSVASSEILHRKLINEVMDELEKFIEEVARRFASDPRVEPIARAKRVKFNTDVCLLCELESAVANKVTIDAIHWNFELLNDFVKSLGEDLIENGLAKRVLGYGLRTGKIDSLEIADVDERREMAFIWLERRGRAR